MKEAIKKIVEKVIEREITDDNSPMYIDSIDFMDIIINIEKTYNIHIDDKNIFKIPSLNDLVELVETYKFE